LMQIFLNPNYKQPDSLREVYKHAFERAEEIYLATAYLTDWDASHKLNSRCKRLTFLVGTNFGLTRKAAMFSVLSWIPKSIPFSFFGAVPPQKGGFHPKVIAWKEYSGKHYCMIGSSNLSRAAFADNFEANVLIQISSSELARICKWIDSLSEGSSPVPISPDWIKHHYKEGKLGSKTARLPSFIQINLPNLPSGRSCAKSVLDHREKQARFVEIAAKIRQAAMRCSRRDDSNSDREFWARFWQLWASHPSRFQGSGIQFKGRSAKWHQACAALIRILDGGSKASSTATLDQLVANEIDGLRKLRNPMRGAWLSEMLCHYFPDRYPIKNKPVKLWLAKMKLRGRRGATEGQRYVELAQKLRLVIQNHHPAGARNLAELDGAIWKWVDDRDLY
jgi:hypothetical protein